MDPLHDDAGLLTPPAEPVWQPRRKFQDRLWVHAALLLLTIVTTTLAGADHWVSFTFDPHALPISLSIGLLLKGLWYSAAILAILGCHELGHYAACRYYDVDASLPYFLPVPLPLTGTLGAFIRIREPIPSKRMLFDIGIAGPIAGFLVAMPLLFAGMAMSRVSPELDVTQLPPDVFVYSTGEPLLYKLAVKMFWGSPPPGYEVSMHPVAFAGWFGLLATALNLFPIGQLDGGHISYAVLGRRSTYVTFAMLAAAVLLSYFYASWRVWTGLMIAMLAMFGPRHPRTVDEHVPLDRTRLLLAICALVMFILCFSPAPIEITDLIRR